VELDPLDLFVSFTMQRSYWLEGDLEASLGSLTVEADESAL